MTTVKNIFERFGAVEKRLADLESRACTCDGVQVEVDLPDLGDADREAITRTIGVIEERLLGLDGRSDEVWRKRAEAAEARATALQQLLDHANGASGAEIKALKATIKEGEQRVEVLRKALDDEKQERNRVYAELVAMTEQRNAAEAKIQRDPLPGDVNATDTWRPW